MLGYNTYRCVRSKGKSSNKEISPFGWLKQGVVTCMSCVEVFATGIKNESSDQSPFRGADQGIKVTSELLKSTDQEHAAAI